MGQGACSLVGGTPGPIPMPAAASITPNLVTAEWTSPSDVTYDIIYGYAPAGVVSVALADTSGAVAATENTHDGWYIISLPAADYITHDRIVYRDASGASTIRVPGQ